MRRLIALAGAVLLTVASQFAQAQASSDYDRSVDFGQYKSYAFTRPDIRTGKNPIYSSPLLMQHIQGNLGRELTNRGLTQQAANPDLLVKVHTYTENKTRTVMHSPSYAPFFPYRWGFAPYRFGYLPYWGGYYGGWNQRLYQENYTQGTLLVDMIDAKTKQLVWRGAIQGVIDNPNRLERQVARGVRKIMKDYPVKAA